MHKTITLILVGMLFGTVQLSSTTIILMTSRYGIVMASDSQQTVRAENIQIGERKVLKIIPVQDRILIANYGWAGIHGGPHDYSFQAWIDKLQRGLPKDISVEEFAGVVKNKSAHVFSIIRTLLNTGALQPDTATKWYDSFSEFVIAGYQGGSPRVYVVQFYIDWDLKQLHGPRQILVEPRPNRSGNFHIYSFGVYQSTTDYDNRESYAYKQLRAICPSEFTNLITGQALPTLDETLTIAHAFVKIEEDTNPGLVAGKIIRFKISPDGRASEVTNDGTRGLGPTTKRTKAKTTKQ